MIDYDPHDWRDHLLDIKGSMVRQISSRVLLCAAWSAAVSLVDHFYMPVAIPSLGHTLIGVALGLLLVFRTNASYDRFWEGRRLWGSIVNDARNLARESSILLAGDPELAGRVIHWTATFPYAAMHRLRGTVGLGPVAQQLAPADVEQVLAANHPPLAIARQIGRTLATAQQSGLITDYARLELDQHAERLIDWIGGCERIHNTPLPFAYMVHLRRSLIVYCFTLPFALVESFGDLGALLATLLLAYTLFGIEEIGVQIEDPFGVDDNDLPLERICENIQANVLAMLPATDQQTNRPTGPEPALSNNVGFVDLPGVARGNHLP